MLFSNKFYDTVFNGSRLDRKLYFTMGPVFRKGIVFAKMLLVHSVKALFSC